MIKISKEDKFYFILTFCMMLLIHGFCFANLLYSHDSLNFYNTDSLWKISIGRWLFPLIIRIRQFAAPWTIGLISSFFVSLSAVLTIRILEFSKKYQNISVIVLFVTNISLFALFCTFIFDGDADCIALCATCFAVYAFKYFPKRINVLVSIISLVICLALYQAYLCVTIGLFLFLVMKKAFQAMNHADMMNTLIYGVKELLVLTISSIIYLICMVAISKYTGISFQDSYNSPTTALKLTLVGALKLIPGCYYSFLKFFLSRGQFNNPFFSFVSKIYFVFIGGVLVYAIIKCIREYAWRLLILIPALLILPIGLNVFYFPALGEIHELMMFAFCLMYLLPFLFFDPLEDAISSKPFLQKTLKTFPYAFILLVGLHFTTYGNGAYTYKKLVYDSTMEHAQTIWKDLMNLDGYTEGETKVYFVGQFWNSNATYRNPIEKRYVGILTGFYPSAISYSLSIQHYYLGILGKNLNLVRLRTDLKTSPEVEAMPVYPLDGYCKMIGDTAVVKLK